MDQHKQFTENVHPIGAKIDPAPSQAVPANKTTKLTFDEADLASDFTPVIDPDAPAPSEPAPEPEVVAAPPLPGDAAKQAAPAVATMAPASRLKALFSKKPVWIGSLVAGVLLLVGGGVLAGHYLKPHAQMVNSGTNLDKSTIYIDSTKHSVGVVAGNNPDGLQVGATVSAAPQGSANIRLGLVSGADPSILFEDGQKNTWQVLGVGGPLQLIQGTTVRAKLDDKALTLTNALNVGGDANVTGNTTLGSSASNTLTIQGANVATPNNLNFGNNTFVVETSKGDVAVGASTAGGYKLRVVGTVKATSLITDGQVLAAAGSAKGPGLSFNNNTNTGIYEPSINTVGVAAGGSQVLQVQQGGVFTVGGANIEADGYLRAGRGSSNPDFQVVRFTGTLDGSGTAVVSDGMSTGYARVLVAQAFYKGNSGEAVQLNIDFVNSGNFQISGGIASRPYRATLIYSADGAGW